MQNKKENISKEYKEKIIALITALMPNVKIYLFGSRATSTDLPGSDVDIALDGGQRLNQVHVGEVRDVLNATNITHKIDVVDLYQVPKEMREIILKEGILWKS